MSRKKTKSKKISKNISFYEKYWNSIVAIFFLLLSLFTFNIDRTSNFWYYYSEFLNNSFWQYYLFIYTPLFLILSIYLFKDTSFKITFFKFVGIILYLTSLTSIFWFFDIYSNWVIFNLSWILSINFWFFAWLFISIIAFFVSLMVLFRFSIIQLIFDIIGDLPDSKTITKSILDKDSTKYVKLNNSKSNKTQDDTHLDSKKKEIAKMMEELDRKKEALEKQKKNNQLNLDEAPKKVTIEKRVKSSGSWLGWFFSSPKKEESVKAIENKQIDYTKWKFPSLDLLNNFSTDINYDINDIKHKELEIQDKLLQFKIDVDMMWFKVGPTVIQYRLKPKDWVKLQRIENLKKDLTLALHAKSIRIQAPIPWQGVVWIEVPNPDRQTIWLKEIIDSKDFNSSKNLLPISIWKDVNWDIVVWDLTKMPHLLVAWQTASWKSIWMNSFLISMLYKFTPSELKFIMIDPKMVELSVYNWIPHLLTPVVTNPDKATNALKWAVAEMLRRYDLAKKVNARNLQEYNKKVTKEEKLPFIVIVIDELADLMMSWNKKEVEWSIARIAQMARAVWMHLIVATQRPSVDVITWLIKANIPSRIAFTVASQIDSRTVIDKAWAEDLLWRWDMLYYPTWSMAPERVQWVLIDTSEVEAIVNHIKLTVDPNMIDNLYDDSIVNWRSKTEWSILENYQWDQEEDPEIIEKAIQVVKEAKKWSTSLVQRKLWLWYARAAKVLDILEELWIVWPANWSKPREVYID